MAKTKETLRDWGERFRRDFKDPGEDDLARGLAAFEEAWKNRDKLDIRPRTTTDLVRETRESR
jgi:hypothetical protein